MGIDYQVKHKCSVNSQDVITHSLYQWLYIPPDKIVVKIKRFIKVTALIRRA